MKLIPYLMFREGKCREAFAFYAHALGGEIVSTATYGDMGPDIPEPMRPFIANIQLLAGGAMIMGADAMENPDGQATTSVNIEVDSIEDAKPLSAAERRAIRELLEGTDDMEQVLARTVRVLSHLTQQVAVIQVPRLDDVRVRHVEFVTLGGTQLLTVLIGSQGSVQQRLVTVPENTPEADLLAVRDAVLTLISGAPMREVPARIVALADTVDPSLFPLAAPIGVVLTELAGVGRADRMVLAGTANLARSSQDFQGNITPVLETLEEQVVLLRLLSELEQDANGVAVSIGSENPHSTLTEASLVASGYGPGNAAMIGVLGPTRMDYPGSIAAVRAIARYLSRILSA